MKAHKIAELERSVASDKSQFKPEGDNAKHLYSSQRSFIKSQKGKSKSKGKDIDAVSNG